MMDESKCDAAAKHWKAVVQSSEEDCIASVLKGLRAELAKVTAERDRLAEDCKELSERHFRFGPEEQTCDSKTLVGLDGRVCSRSSEWEAVRKKHLQIEPCCQVCGGKDVEVHHVLPYHFYPDSELSPSNLLTLCHDHHFELGHLRDWRAWNIRVRQDAVYIRQRILYRNYERVEIKVR